MREKKTDSYSVRSANSLKGNIDKQIRNVFKSALRAIELKLGKDFEGFDAIRSDILGTGNDAIRELHDLIDTKFNVEELPVVFTVNFKERKNGKGK